MKPIPRELLIRMGDQLAPEDRDEMAIPSYLHPNPLMRRMAWRRVEVLAQHLAKTCIGRRTGSNPVILDYGCGAGVLLEEASRYAQRVYGVDPNLVPAQLLIEEWKLDKVTLLTPEQAAEEIPGKSLDIILAAEVLEHIDPLQPTLGFFRSRLKPNGKLLVSVPTENVFYKAGRWLAGFKGDYHHSDASRITREIAGAGFKEEGIEKVPAPGPFALYWVGDYGV